MEETPQNTTPPANSPLISAGTKHWSIKILIIIIALIAFQIPLFLIEELAGDRRDRHKVVQDEITAAWGGEQKIQVFPADKERYDVNLSSQIRYRGIYQILIYSASVRIDAELQNLSNAQNAFVLVSDTDKVEHCTVQVDGKPVAVKKAKTSFKFQLPAGSSKYSVSLKVNGSGKFNCSSGDAKYSTINISGNWKSPGFIGGRLPNSRTITDKGFSAKWIRHNMIPGEEIGVELCLPGGTYQQVRRGINYAAFFLIVFFFSLIFAELFTKIHIHPLQYIIAACAPVLFYLMTLAFSEKAGFTAGYIISAAVIVAMITMYARLFLGKSLPALILGAVFSASYFLNFSIMRMEDNALLAGTAVFALILGTLMILTGKINRKQDPIQ